MIQNVAVSVDGKKFQSTNIDSAIKDLDIYLSK
jgi:hypothetical protein